MAAEPKVVRVAPDSEIARLLDAADGQPLVIETDHARFRLVREDDAAQDDDEDIWAGYDPDAVIAALDAVAGSWSDVDADAMIERVYRARDEGSRPIDRP